VSGALLKASGHTRSVRMQGNKVLIVVMDGLGDRAVEGLGWRTPLQSAKRPNFNWYAAHGSSGIVDTIGPGIRPGSDTSHLAILGYDPYQVYTGRGPFEAAGIGLIGKKGDVAFRCNFAPVDSNFTVIDRRAGRIKEPETAELAGSVDGMTFNGVRAIVKEATEHRAVLLLRGEDLSARVSDVDPHNEGQVKEAKPLSPEGSLTANVVNRFVRESYNILKDHPVNKRRMREGKPVANILLPRGAGVFPDIIPFGRLHGMTAGCVAGVSLIKGICRVCGLDVVDVEGATGGIDTDMLAKANSAIRMLDKKDLVLMNIKAPDIASHDGDYRGKVRIIERLDKMAGLLRKELADGTVVAFTADHCTPVEMRDHSGDPVPLMIYSASSLRSGVRTYDEVAAALGGLGRLKGKDILPILLDRAGRSEKFGA
jgi:2,3-bisphosphoglycerate-independent phosphoglycerate mutase